MATSNVTDLAAAAAANKPKARRFTAADAEDVYRNVTEARAICRVVALATSARLDGSVLDDASVSPWEPSIAQACGLLQAARAALMETSDAPNYNWWTPLNLLEALCEALWHAQCPGHDELDNAELASFMNVAINSIDALMRECEQPGSMLEPARSEQVKARVTASGQGLAS